jgi:hypothetical protein
MKINQALSTQQAVPNQQEAAVERVNSKTSKDSSMLTIVWSRFVELDPPTRPSTPTTTCTRQTCVCCDCFGSRSSSPRSPFPST